MAIAVMVSVVLLAGLLLWGSHRHEPGASSNLGAALLAGVLAAVAIFAVQSSFQAALDREARRREAAEARQALQLSLSAQQAFPGIDLSGRDLTGFYLRGKNFTDADLAGATLRGATLIGANLNNANLDGATLTGANLTGANLNNANLDGARADRTTRWPSGFDWAAAGVLMDPPASP